MHRSYSSYVLAVMALLTLGMIMMLPVLGDPAAERTTVENAAPSLDEIALDRGKSAQVRVEGGQFTRGTTQTEINTAIQACSTVQGACDPSLSADALPAHRLQIDPFWMDVTEVTYRQYVNFLNTLGARGHLNCEGQLCALTSLESSTSAISFDGTGYDTTNPAFDDFPVVNVTWHGAQAYCQSLGRRLPTEAEWEYAARGLRGTLYPWGNEWTYEAANVRGSTSSDGTIIAGAQPVGGHVDYASRDGIRDLSGNVAEWVADWYAADWYRQPGSRAVNSAGPAEGAEKVVRGGSWNDLPFFARAVQRWRLMPETTSFSVGFRCVSDD
ncbi:MAG: formylglycine-generating enzyme family protein [bacterium]|nr:formylglycine-generating enzyme family protein [bacterium]